MPRGKPGYFEYDSRVRRTRRRHEVISQVETRHRYSDEQPPMNFVFEKIPNGKYDRLRVTRSGRTEEILCPKVGGIPHDMVHFAVENVMAVAGYMRRIAGGEALTLQMSGNLEADQMERLVEVMQADANSGFPPAADLIDMYRVTCEARGVVPYAVRENHISALRAEMRRLERLWDATPPGGAMTLSFDDGSESELSSR